MRIAVLGAGVSGLTVSRLLKDKGHFVTVYEKESTLGGLARTRVTDGYLYDPHGGHIFNSKNKKVVDWVFSFLSKDKWKFTERNAKIFFRGKYISYPFELSLCELDVEDAVDCLYDFVLAKEGDEPDDFKGWLTWNFGRSIADYYMIPYNEKIWAYPLEEMETRWVRDKMPLPEKKDLIRSMLLKDPTERKMPHSTFYYPLKGGIQSMVNAIAKGLDIKLGTSISSIEKVKNGYRINGTEEYDRVISTIPLPELPNIYMGLPDEIIYHMKDLKFNSLTTVLFDCPKTDISWLYIPSHDYRAHRVCYQSSLTPYASTDPDKGCAALEIIGKKLDVDNGFVNGNGILPEELCFNRVIDYEFTKYAYVIHDKNYRGNIEAIHDFFENDESFDLLGRWGLWNYKNMDMCMWDAMELVNSRY